MNILAVRAFGVTVHVVADDERVAADLRDVFRLLDVHDLRVDAPPADATHVHAEGRAYIVTRRGALVASTDVYGYLIASLAYRVYGEIRERAERHLLVHAGAVCREDRGVAFAAEKGRGKSTLVAHLVKAGCRYLTDDMAAFDIQTGLLVPFPRAIELRGASPSVLEPTGNRLTISRYGDDADAYTGRYALARPDAVRREPVAARAVVFTCWRDGARARLERVGRAEAGGELARLSANMDRLGASGFDAVARLAATADAYRMEYGNLEDARAMVEEILGDAPRE